MFLWTNFIIVMSFGVNLYYFFFLVRLKITLNKNLCKLSVFRWHFTYGKWCLYDRFHQVLLCYVNAMWNINKRNKYTHELFASLLPTKYPLSGWLSFNAILFYAYTCLFSTCMRVCLFSKYFSSWFDLITTCQRVETHK